MYRLVWVAAVLAACGGDKPDDCERVYAKLVPVVEGLSGEPLPAADRAGSLAECRALTATHADDVFVTCVLAAGSADAVKACLGESKRPAPKPEAVRALDKLMGHAKVYYHMNRAYPIGTAATLPAQPCCRGSGGLCAADTAAWHVDPTWAALGFALGEPGHFQYSYTSDGKSLVATAVGDPDCTGSASTYTLNMAWDGKHPTGKITEPF